MADMVSCPDCRSTHFKVILNYITGRGITIERIECSICSKTADFISGSEILKEGEKIRLTIKWN